jgi:hypothetical protein
MCLRLWMLFSNLFTLVQFGSRAVLLTDNYSQNLGGGETIAVGVTDMSKSRHVSSFKSCSASLNSLLEVVDSLGIFSGCAATEITPPNLLILDALSGLALENDSCSLYQFVCELRALAKRPCVMIVLVDTSAAGAVLSSHLSVSFYCLIFLACWHT